ncbi:hypothetical protein CSKR_112349 [Clonorchis sinensis]|uniref:Uncharacterized protein n=1 Tax=Clonorchis sinensis TaxID=79923 RepID=A0A3R7FKJ1_CLOSI|nr:hypothetical protein CSKR_112349 [Clonorchis sinensis]
MISIQLEESISVVCATSIDPESTAQMLFQGSQTTDLGILIVQASGLTNMPGSRVGHLSASATLNWARKTTPLRKRRFGICDIWSNQRIF